MRVRMALVSGARVDNCLRGLDRPGPAWGMSGAGKERERYAPTFNTLVVFEVPRRHAVLPVRKVQGMDKQLARYSVFGWWLREEPETEVETQDRAEAQVEDEAGGEGETEGEGQAEDEQGPVSGGRASLKRKKGSEKHLHRAKAN